MTIFWILVTAAIPALGFLSYQHFESFKKVAYTLLIASLIIVFAAIVWNDTIRDISYDTRTAVQGLDINYEVTDYKDYPIYFKLKEIRQTASEKAYNTISSSVVDIGNIFIAFLLLIGYLSLLMFSPSIINDHPHNNRNKTKN